jgi:hypothetical protein
MLLLRPIEFYLLKLIFNLVNYKKNEKYFTYDNNSINRIFIF